MAFDAGLAHPETLIEDRPSRFSASYAPENFDLTFQGTVSARRALQLSLNVPAVALMEAVGPARFVAHLRAAGADLRLPREAAPGLPVAWAARPHPHRPRPALCRPRPRGADAAPVEAKRIAGDVAAWYVADILRGTPPPDNALPNRIAYKTGTSFGYRDAWAVGFDRRVTIAVWVGRRDGAAVPGLVGRIVAARPCSTPSPATAASRPSARALPKPWSRPTPPCRRPCAASPTTRRRRRARSEDRLSAGRGGSISASPHRAPRRGGVILKASGGVPPLTWMIDGMPVDRTIRRQSTWVPEGAGFARISVLDANGATDSVAVRIE